MSERLKDVLKWSSRKTSEACTFNLADYYWTDAIKKVLFRLTNADRGLLGIQGLQGTGKTAALTALDEMLNARGYIVVRYKWVKDFKKQFFDELGYDYDDNYVPSLWNRCLTIEKFVEDNFRMATDIPKYYLRTWKQATDQKEKDEWEERLNKIANQEKLETLLGERVVKDVKQTLLENFLRTVQVVLLDMPDYNKNNLQRMDKDIEDLQHIWSEFMATSYSKVSFVIAVQKEIVMRKPHFFFGKVGWVNLKPLAPDELLEAYRQKWGIFEPFTEDSLRLIAKLSRGVFRRFLGYINITIERFQMLNKSGEITSEDVEAAVSFEVLFADLELELADIFSNTQQRMQAVKVLDLLRKDNLSQKEIASSLSISEAFVTNLIAKLNLYGYVNKTRAEGTTWIVSLA